jgi:hypothetical protein
MEAKVLRQAQGFWATLAHCCSIDAPVGGLGKPPEPKPALEGEREADEPSTVVLD